MQTSGTNSEHKHSEIKHFSTLNCNKCKIIKTQKTLSLSIASKFSDMHLCFVFCAVFVLSLLLVIMGGQHDRLLLSGSHYVESGVLITRIRSAKNAVVTNGKIKSR